MPHRVEGEEIVFSDPVILAEEFQAGFEDAGLCVLERHTYAQHGAPIVVVEIDTLGHFSSSDTEQDGASPVAACCAIGFER